jgi:hypothetical protein
MELNVFVLCACSGRGVSVDIFFLNLQISVVCKLWIAVLAKVDKNSDSHRSGGEARRMGYFQISLCR